MQYFEREQLLARGKLYEQIADMNIRTREMDSVSFHFDQPKNGIINMTVNVNEEKKFVEPIKRLTNLSQFVQIREWLEDVVNEDIECCRRISRENHKDMYFHYEMFYKAFVGSMYIKGESVNYDVNDNPSKGLFYIYDAQTQSIPFFAICYTADLVDALQKALIELCLNNVERTDNFITEWYFYENYDYFEWKNNCGMWNFYNDIQSKPIAGYRAAYWKLHSKNRK